jgi:hypothetical protein
LRRKRDGRDARVFRVGMMKHRILVVDHTG